MSVSRVVFLQPFLESVSVALLPSVPHSTPSPVPPPLVAFAGLPCADALAARDFALRFFPVFDFQRHTVAALFCTPMFEGDGAGAIYGHGAFRFGPLEWAEIDCAILEHANAFAVQLLKQGIVAAVGASVSFSTLDDPRGRALYREALRGAHADTQPNLVIKIEDIPDAAGAQRVGMLVQSLKGLAPRVWVHLPGSHVPMGGHEMLSAMGLVLSMPAKLPFHGMQTEARWLARQAQTQSALACMDHVDKPNELDVVRGAGVRFAAGMALGRPVLAATAEPDEIRSVLYA
jgi:hypothetical protein